MPQNNRKRKRKNANSYLYIGITLLIVVAALFVAILCVAFGSCGEDGFMVPDAGFGHVSIDKEEFKLTGEIFGAPIDFSVKTDRIGAFPVSPGDHIDIYHEGKLIYIYPQPDLNASVKWVCYLDKFNADKAALKY